MIYLFTGTPGSGKSLHAARLIRDSLKWAKLPVIANFPINEGTKGYERFTYVPNDKLTPDFLYDFARNFWGGRPVKEDKITLVVDEAQLLFNSRDWGQSNRMAWIEFLSQHRHFGYRIFLMCQFDRMIDRQIRSLCEYEWQHRKLGNYGWKGKFMRLFTFGELFICVKVFYGLGDKIGTEVFRADRKLFKLYDSYSTFRRVGGAEGGALGGPRPMADGAPEGAPAAVGLEVDSKPVSDAKPTLSPFLRLRAFLRRFLRRLRGSPGKHQRTLSDYRQDTEPFPFV